MFVMKQARGNNEYYDELPGHSFISNGAEIRREEYRDRVRMKWWKDGMDFLIFRRKLCCFFIFNNR